MALAGTVLSGGEPAVDGAPTADGTVAVETDYLLDVGSSSFTLLTVRIKERFDLRCELITYIKATVGLP